MKNDHITCFNVSSFCFLSPGFSHGRHRMRTAHGFGEDVQKAGEGIQDGTK